MRRDLFVRLVEVFKGGAGSGNFGHEGRPGKVGGSGSGSRAGSFTYDEVLEQFQRGVDLAIAGRGKAPTMGGVVNSLTEAAGFSINKDLINHPPASREDMMRAVKEHGISEEDFSVMSGQWQRNSNKDSSNLLHEAVWRAADGKGMIETDGVRKARRQIASGKLPQGIEDREIGDKAVSLLREQTAKKLQSLGYGPDDKITLFRGMDKRILETHDLSAGGSFTTRDVPSKPVSSWTISPSRAFDYTAGTFSNQMDNLPGGVMIATTVSAKDILSLGTWFGNPAQDEVLLTGDALKTMHVVFRGS